MEKILEKATATFLHIQHMQNEMKVGRPMSKKGLASKKPKNHNPVILTSLSKWAYLCTAVYEQQTCTCRALKYLDPFLCK